MPVRYHLTAFIYAHRCSSPSVTVTRSRTDKSTGNLHRHITACAPVAPDNQSITKFAHGSTYSKERMRYLLAVWIARRHRPFAIVEDDELKAIFRMLDGSVDIPSRITVSRDVREIFGMARKQVGKILREYPGRLHLALDGWTSPNVYSFLGVTVHRVVNGKMSQFILDFIR